MLLGRACRLRLGHERHIGGIGWIAACSSLLELSKITVPKFLLTRADVVQILPAVNAGIVTVVENKTHGVDYDAKTNRVTFSATQVRTYTVLAAPGAVSYESQLSNKSRERTGGSSISGSNINSTVSSGDTSAQTSQINKTELKFDIWREV